MWSSFWQLVVESRDFFQTEKERTACKYGQIQKMTTVFTQNCPRLSFLEFAHLCKQFFLSQFEKNHVIQQPIAKN